MELIRNYADATLREKYAAEVDTAERAADKITAEVNRLLHKTFITPIDREQIHGLINAMDDVLDLLQDSTETLSLYDVRADDRRRRAPGRAVGQVLRARAACGEPAAQDQRARGGRGGAQDLRGDRPPRVRRRPRDALGHSRLFRDEKVDMRELIKLKAVYEQLESITDRCEDVANLIEGVVLENS